VRAVTHPYPGAFCFVGGRKLLVWEAKIGAENGSLDEPGRVVRETADGALEIAAGEGSVIVKIAQFEGGAEGIAREALSEAGRVKHTILFD
jgi:methionyl-tRNA formyltransferase